ncbi:tRNA pseudouridine(13) synthase TruD [Streptomyces sp. NPDC001339]|uniref:tRNA pseudouridine(13) synthase TruD n=1 Tax=Streptomyces sp. NPDC001339 TaxID=3364563 RepID=UPI003685DF9E
MPVLKRIPSEFLVAESSVLPAVDSEVATHQQLRLRKAGYTTFEAVDLIARFHGQPSANIGYAGLKDEDAITEQFLTISGPLDSRALEEFNQVHAAGAPGSHGRFLQLRHHGYGMRPLSAGDLDGNSFRIMVRDLEAEHARHLAGSHGRRSLFAINYYDTQRFGVPDGPRQTHLLGGALLEGDYERAFELLRASRSPEARTCSAFTGTAREFFDALDPRRIAFFQSAHASDVWNAEVRALLREVAGDDVLEEEREGIPYVFPRAQSAALQVAQAGRRLRCRTYRWRNGGMVSYLAPRPVVVQLQVRIADVKPDECFEGRWCCTLAFFLPSGSYGTIAVSQLLHAVAGERQ